MIVKLIEAVKLVPPYDSNDMSNILTSNFFSFLVTFVVAKLSLELVGVMVHTVMPVQL